MSQRENVYICGSPEKRSQRPHDVCVMMYGKCICDSTGHCRKESTRIYSLNDPKFDRCYKELPCPDHPILPDRMVSSSNVAQQPAPVPNDLPAVWGLVMKDMVDRDQLGRERYGVPLQPNNGRDALKDAYDEALDLAVYLRQAIYERDTARAA